MSEGTVEEVLAGEARWHLHAGDFRALLATLPDACLDSCVCDPPYELGFMGRKWDASGIAYDVDGWRSVLRVLKPGGHLLAFGGTRTYHRMACAIEDAGFDIRDCIQWLYASGFPKSLDVSKAIDAHNGDERPVVGRAAAWTNERAKDKCVASMNTSPTEYDLTSAASAAWDGWGTALKPACEPIVVARKPLIGTVAANVLAHGTGGINIDGCRVEGGKRSPEFTETRLLQPRTNAIFGADNRPVVNCDTEQGRWPANVIHDGSPEVLEAFARYGDRESSQYAGGNRPNNIFGDMTQRSPGGYDQSGSAARFFFCAKASRAERELGCEGLAGKSGDEIVHRKEGSAGMDSPRAGAGRTVRDVGGAIHTRVVRLAKNFHPTVKPLALLRYLCRLVTPPGGTVLDPFSGSGTMGMAAILEGFRYLGAELDETHVPIARARVGHPLRVEEPDAPEGEAPRRQLGLF